MKNRLIYIVIAILFIGLFLNEIGSCFAAAAPLIGEGLPIAYATGSLPPRDELPLINVQTA